MSDGTEQTVFFQVQSPYYHESEGCAGKSPHSCTITEATGVKEPCPTCTQ